MHRNVRLLYLHNLLSDFRFQEAFLPIYFAQITGSYASAMTIFAVSTLTSAILDIPTGIFSDRMGRKFTLIVASSFNAMGIACYAFATTTPLLFVGAIFCGLSECMFNGNNDALMYESLKSSGEEGRFHHYQGRAKSMYQVGLATSALCSVFLTHHGLRLVFMLGIIPQILSTGISFLVTEPRIHVRQDRETLSHLKTSWLLIRRNPRLMWFILAQAICNGDEATFRFQTAYFNTLWPTWALGIYRAMNHVLGFTGFWISGFVLDRFKPMNVLIFRGVYWLFSGNIAVLLSNVFTPLVSMTGALPYGPGMVARDKILQEEFTDKQRATMGSISSFACSIVFAAVAWGIGIVSDHFGLAVGMRFGVCCAGLSVPIYIGLARKLKHG